MNGSEIGALRSAWSAAARVLGIRIQTKGCWLADRHGRRHELVAVVPDFGGENGMAILPAWDASLAELAVEQGYGCTVLAAGYETFDREAFEDALNDWQWTGDGDPPSWYTGVAAGEH